MANEKIKNMENAWQQIDDEIIEMVDEYRTARIQKVFHETKAVCQGCGEKAIKQSDEQMNGRDNLFACANCRMGWMEAGDNIALEDCFYFQVSIYDNEREAKLITLDKKFETIEEAKKKAEEKINNLF